MLQSVFSEGSDTLGSCAIIETGCTFERRAHNYFITRIYFYESGHMLFEQAFEEDLVLEEDGGDIDGFPGLAFHFFEGGEWKPDLHILTYVKNRTFNYPILRCGNASQTGQEGRNTPLVLTDRDFNAMVLSPAEHFLIGTVALSEEGPVMACGLPSAVKIIPKGTVYRTLLTVAKGVNNALDLWGKALRILAGTREVDRYEDASLTYLNYWTDAGAAYWYNTMTGKNYEETLLEVFRHHQDLGLPVGVYQLDSWWYYRDGEYTSSIVRWLPKEKVLCKNYNAANADALPDGYEVLFPTGGIEFLQQKLQKPVIAHFKHISTKSEYVKGNPNSNPPVRQFEFVKGIHAIPKNYEAAKDFFHYVMEHPEWGLVTLEHDWLDDMYYKNDTLRTLEGGRSFFKGMSDAAMESSCKDNIVPHRTLQLCMAHPAITLESVELAAVTTLRTSADGDHNGHEGAERWWWNTYSGRLVNALGKMSFFDNRHSNRKGGRHTASNSRLEFIWICMSCGILGLGDYAGSEDVPLVLQCVDSRGVVIKPEKPAVPLDKCYLFNPYSGDAREALILYAFDRKSAGKTFFVQGINCNRSGADVRSAFAVRELDPAAGGRFAVYDFLSGEVHVVSPDTEICDFLSEREFSYKVISPLAGGISIFGDITKFIPASGRLLEDVVVDGGDVLVRVNGAEGESIVVTGFAAYKPAVVRDENGECIPEGCAEGKLPLYWTWDDWKKLFAVHVKIGEMGKETIRITAAETEKNF